MNILKLTIRNLTRKPVTNLINLLGLAISLVLVIILAVYSYRKLTTDQFHTNGDRLYLYGQLNKGIYTPGILKDQIDLNVPGVESTVRIAGTWEPPVFQVENNDPVSSDMIFADEDFFRLFTYKALAGNPETALIEPMSIVITRSLAVKLFGKEQAIGRTLKLNNRYDLTITSVIEEPAANSCLSFSAVCSSDTRKLVQPNKGEFTEWRFFNFQTFLLLKNGIDPTEAAKKILALFPENLQSYNKEAGLIPFKNLYFSKSVLGRGGDYLIHGDKRKVMILLMVASLVLMIALVNFINIASSQWLDKIKQTGIMKILGAKQSTIFQHVLSESLLLFFTALVTAIIFIVLFNPFIQYYTGIHFNPKIVYTPGFILISIFCTLILSILFSLMPAWRISCSKVVNNLKRSVESSSARSSLRGILVAAQFSISIILIAFTILIQKQVRFGSTELGFNQDNIIGIKLTLQLNQKKDVLEKTLMDKPFVKDISFTQYYPGKIFQHWGTILNLNGEEKEVEVDWFAADASIFDMMGLELTMGRFYTDNLSTDKGKVVVNETFLHEYSITDPIGGKIIISMDGTDSEIIGVVNDFHFKPVSQPITPLAIVNEPHAFYCLVNLHTTSFNYLHTSIQDIKATVSELSPSFPVEVGFFDQAVENMYKSELQFRGIFSLFAACAIVICCMGILAMSLSACQLRVKEIGIRKVNGARVSEILTMLNKDFVKWVVIAFIIATPVAWCAMNKWLQNFAYKTSLSWWIFALAGVIALGIALLTVSWQSWRAATRNPVEALRYE
jgi:putative ABC transport system permease protein